MSATSSAPGGSDRRALLGVLVAALLAACSPEGGDAAAPGDGPSAAPGSPPNLVVILIDTLRADYLSFYGHEEETAPFLADLARRSTVFRRTFSTSSWTAPATASLFTGLVPPRHGLIQGFHAQRKQAPGGVLSLRPLPEDRVTLPERLRDAGYQTYGIATNINIGPELGFSRGFHRFERLPQETPAPALLDRARAWMEEARAAEPWLLYLHFMDVHEPLEGREPWYQPATPKVMDLRARYLSELAYLDQALQTFFRDPPWDPDDTVVWFLSDHGEEFKDHGKKGHGFTLYQELTGVLNMVHAPALGVPAQVVEANVSLVDVLPTLVEWAGAEPLEDGDGRSLLPWLQGQPDAATRDDWDQRVVFAHRQKRGGTEEMAATVLGRFKLIQDKDTGEFQLFDLQEDPGETRNLYRSDHPLLRMMDPPLQALWEASVDTAPVHIDLSEDVLQEVRGLGYTDDGDDAHAGAQDPETKREDGGP